MAKPKKCKYSKCGEMFDPVPGRFNQQTCNKAECAYGYVIEVREKKEAKEKDQLLKAYKENVKDLSAYKKDFQDNYINKIVRLIDRGHPCMSSGRSNYTAHAGHVKSVGAHENIRFNLLVIYAQSDSDNTYGGGNVSRFRDGIESTFGKELLDEIDGLSLKYKEIRIRKVDIVEAKLVAARIIKELESEDRVLNNQERIERRRAYNQRLGIYG